MEPVEASVESSDVAQSEATQEPSNFGIHLTFIIFLAAILAWKYYIYFYPDATFAGMSAAARLGATISHLLIWAVSYAICVYGSRKRLLLVMACVTLFVGVLTVPILGWIGLVVMLIVYNRSARA
jgi:hypothetical protein